MYVCIDICMYTHTSTRKDRRKAVVYPCEECRKSIYMKNIVIGNPEGMRQCYHMVDARDKTHTICT